MIMQQHREMPGERFYMRLPERRYAAEPGYQQ
jgi:hypothetical protein